MDSGSNLECTGERVIENEYKSSASKYLIYLFHIATYNFCLPYVRNKKVLDFGSGSGYGTSHIAGECKHITGIDISDEAVGFARQNYKKENLEYLAIGDIQQEPLPFSDNEFDTVISFQVMEHIAKVDKYLSEIKRVLKNNGKLVIATPDRKSRLFPGQKPWNVYHITEYDVDTFRATLCRHFPVSDIYGMSGSKGVIDIELRRTSRLRLITYLFTFPFCPEWYRQSSLRLLKYIEKKLSSKDSHRQNKTDTDYGFNVDDIMIKPGIKNSVNIISVSTNTK